MKLLWLTKTFPYPSLAGDVIYTRHLIEGCARLGVRVHVVCHPSTIGPDAKAPDLPGLTWKIVAAPLRKHWLSLLSPLPNAASVFGARQRHDETLKALDEVWDGIVFDSLGSLTTFSEIRKAAAKLPMRPFLVHVSHNHEATTRRTIARKSTNPVLKLVQHLDAFKSARLEGNAVRGCDLLVVNTEEDWRLFEREHPDTRHIVIRPGYDGPRSARRSWARLPRTVVVLGSYQWVAKRLNVEALLKAAATVFPAAGIRLRIIGFMDKAYRDHLAKNFPWADIVGPVEDVGRELETARIGIVPEQAGGGFKHKLLNYVFSRVAVASLEGAMAGSGLEANRHYISALDIPALVKSVVAMIDRNDTLEIMTDAAYVECEKQFDWRQRCRDMVAALENAM